MLKKSNHGLKIFHKIFTKTSIRLLENHPSIRTPVPNILSVKLKQAKIDEIH